MATVRSDPILPCEMNISVEIGRLSWKSSATEFASAWYSGAF
jgi:hypothetical protein